MIPVLDIFAVGEHRLKTSSLATFNRNMVAMKDGHLYQSEPSEDADTLTWFYFAKHFFFLWVSFLYIHHVIPQAQYVSYYICNGNIERFRTKSRLDYIHKYISFSHRGPKMIDEFRVLTPPSLLTRTSEPTLNIKKLLQRPKYNILMAQARVLSTMQSWTIS